MAASEVDLHQEWEVTRCLLGGRPCAVLRACNESWMLKHGSSFQAEDFWCLVSFRQVDSAAARVKLPVGLERKQTREISKSGQTTLVWPY